MSLRGTGKIIAGVVAILFIGWVIFQMDQLRENDAQQVTKIELAQIINELCDKPENESEAVCDEPLQGVQGLPGVAGVRGPPGQAGVAGADGTDGAEGAPGATGDAGLTGPQGPAGPPGQDGADGAQGPQGEPGETCPEGTSLQETTVMTSPIESTVIYACR